MTRTILISRHSDRAGASTLAAALADNRAAQGASVLLIDLDPERSGIYRFIDDDDLLPRADITRGRLAERLAEGATLAHDHLLPFLGWSANGAQVLCPLGGTPLEIGDAEAAALAQVAATCAEVLIVDVGRSGGDRQRALENVFVSALSVVVATGEAETPKDGRLRVTRGIDIDESRALRGDRVLRADRLPGAVQRQLDELGSQIGDGNAAPPLVATPSIGEDVGAATEEIEPEFTEARTESRAPRRLQDAPRWRPRLRTVAAVVPALALLGFAAHGSSFSSRDRVADPTVAHPVSEAVAEPQAPAPRPTPRVVVPPIAPAVSEAVAESQAPAPRPTPRVVVRPSAPAASSRLVVQPAPAKKSPARPVVVAPGGTPGAEFLP